MVRDVANPPVASRFYAYPILAAYIVLLQAEEDLDDITMEFTSPPNFQKISTPKGFSKEFSALYTMLEVGKKMMPSGYLLNEKQEDLKKLFRKNHRLSKKKIAANIEFSLQIANQVLDYVKTDGYNKLSTYIQYSPKKTDSTWFPTPPSYMHAIEPHWNTVRPFFIQQADQFTPQPPIPFDTSRTSKFYEIMNEVYTVTQNLSAEQKEIAGFWDCNPFAVEYSGHMAIGIKKISPGGHWIGITGIACLQANFDLLQTIRAHTLLALTLHDAFISCWDEKYRSDRIRPETVINQYIDQDWRPLLQTPPFPEFTSGHSVVSASAGEILTAIFGEPFEYVDTSEEYFGLAPRKFTSFRAAAREAAISRLYGGIHYRDAIDYGVEQGQKLGLYIRSKVLIDH